MMNAQDVKTLRSQLGLSQTQFAQLLGTTSTSVSQWERGVAVPRLLAVKAMQDLITSARINAGNERKAG